MAELLPPSQILLYSSLWPSLFSFLTLSHLKVFCFFKLLCPFFLAISVTWNCLPEHWYGVLSLTSNPILQPTFPMKALEEGRSFHEANSAFHLRQQIGIRSPSLPSLFLLPHHGSEEEEQYSNALVQLFPPLYISFFALTPHPFSNPVRPDFSIRSQTSAFILYKFPCTLLVYYYYYAIGLDPTYIVIHFCFYLHRSYLTRVWCKLVSFKCTLNSKLVHCE